MNGISLLVNLLFLVMSEVDFNVVITDIILQQLFSNSFFGVLLIVIQNLIVRIVSIYHGMLMTI